jgi:alpha-tubulin suppressor-like RCC1 family protein
LTRGHSQTCGVTTAGPTLCAGHNDWGQIGREPKRSSDTTVAEYGTGLSTIELWTDDFYTCALQTDGHVYCSGQGGPPTNDPTNGGPHGTPIRIGGDNVFTAISVGHWHGCGLETTGKAWCWGYNDEGQLGTGDFESSGTARPVAGGPAFTRIFLYDFTSCGVTATGELWCWGSNRGHVLGRTRLEKTNTPIQIKVGSPVTWIDRLAQTLESGACVIDGQSRLMCWGAILGAPSVHRIAPSSAAN